jgi:hypothetical protein
LNAEDIRELFRVIDWLMELPKSLSDLFWEDVQQLQKERHMPFISTPERVGEWRGLRKGIESVLRIRFGAEGLKLMPEINKLYGEAELTAILQALETAKSPEEVRPLFEDAK